MAFCGKGAGGVIEAPPENASELPRIRIVHAVTKAIPPAEFL